MASWDDENFDVAPATPAKIAITDKWEGEDEDDDVKDNWEDEEEEISKEEDIDPPENTEPEAKKMTLQEKIAEKERIKQEELELRLQEEAELTPEECLKRQQKSDLNLFVETTLGDKSNFDDDLTTATSKKQFEELGTNITKQILMLSKSNEYPTYLEELIQDICVTLTARNIRKIKLIVDSLYFEKQKMEKSEKTKKTKGKGKITLKMDDNNQYSAFDIDTYNEFDDFM